MRLTNELPRAWWKKLILYLLHLLAFLVVFIIWLWLSSSIFQWLSPGSISSFWGNFFIPWLAVLIGALLSVYLFDQLKVGARIEQLGFVGQRFSTGSRIGLYTGSGLILLSFLLLWLGGWVTITDTNFEFGLFMSWLLFFLVQPLAEEVMMRSFLQSQTQYYFGPQAGLIVTALVFGLLHADNSNFSWIAGVEIAAGGYLMGLLYLHTQSIWGPYLMHASWNFLQSTVLGFAVSGMDTYHWLSLDIKGPEWLTGGDFGIEGSVVSLVLLLVAIGWFWSARKNELPLAIETPILADDETLLDESDTL